MLTAQELHKILKEADTGLKGMKYSGRGMMGAFCFGIMSRTIYEALADLIDGAVAYDERTCSMSILELTATIRNIQVDSMGRHAIVYFPAVKWEEPEKDPEGEG